MIATRRRTDATTSGPPKPVNVAIYCRQSVTGDAEVGSIQSQRECVEKFVEARHREGWRVVEAHYDDECVSGADATRPALGRLLHDIEAGHIQMVASYKLDRLSRNLVHFLQLILKQAYLSHAQSRLPHAVD